MSSYNTTWISTVTGTGTTWTFSIVRELLSHTTLNVLPEKVYQTTERYLKIYEDEAQFDFNSNNHYILQGHAALELDLIQKRSKVISCFRNPYDNCASHYEFMKCDLETAIENALHIPLLIKHYAKLDRDKFLLLRFEAIDENPVSLIKSISDFLGVQINKENAENLAQKYSRENVRKIIANNERSLVDKLLAGETVLKEEVCIDGDDVRSFDTKTGYQSRQISDRKTGEWRSAFSEPQILRIIEALDEVARILGYKSEKL